jgi:hypothetical protein
LSIATIFVSDPIAPSAPSNLVATNTSYTGLRLNWNHATDNVAVTHYNIYMNGNYVATVDGNRSYYHFNQLITGNTYVFVVRALDGEKNFTDSNSVSVLKATTFYIKLRGDIIYDILEYPYMDYFPATIAGVLPSGLHGGWYRWNGVTYVFDQVLYDAAMKEIEEEENPTDPNNPPNTESDLLGPTEPTHVIGTNISNSIFQLDWNHAYDNIGVTQYKIYINGIHEATVDGDYSSYQFGHLMIGNTYDFVVRALDAAQNYSDSTSVSVLREQVFYIQLQGDIITDIIDYPYPNYVRVKIEGVLPVGIHGGWYRWDGTSYRFDQQLYDYWMALIESEDN